MANLKPWYQVVTPREDLRENRPLDASEFAVHLDHVRDARYWRLAQALSTLYPASTDEKRWVDGVLARKKWFGF